MKIFMKTQQKSKTKQYIKTIKDDVIVKVLH